MRCSKCNSPIISGEEYCKICGTRIDKMPKVEKKEKKPIEVIDFEIDEEKQNETVSKQLDEINMISPVDETMSKTNYVVDHSSFDDGKKNDDVFGVTLTDLNMKPIVLGTTIKMPSVSEEDIKNYEKKIEEEIVEPKEINEENELTEEKQTAEEPLIEDENDGVTLDDLPIINEDLPEEPVKQVVKKEVKDEVKKEPIDNKRIEQPKQGKNDLLVAIVAILLVISIVLNVYLFMTKSSKETTEVTNTSKITKSAKIMFEGYKMDINAGWTTEFDGENKMTLLYDNSSEWIASVQIIDDVDYDILTENNEDFAKEMKELKYDFTSNYVKQYNKKDYYIFKGKNETDTVYLIISKVDKDTIAIATVSFKDEVNDKLIKNLSTTLGTITENKGEEIKTSVTTNLSELCQKYGVKEVANEDDVVELEEQQF